MPANLDSLEVVDPDADDTDAGGDHGRMLGDLKRSLLRPRRRTETRPPSAAMDVHGLRRLGAGADGQRQRRTRVQEVLSAALGGEAAKRAVGQELRAAQRRHRVLEAPVRLVEAKSQRIAAYERANKDLGCWYGYVERNRLSEEVSFPLPPTGAPRPQSAADYRQRARADIAVAAASAVGGGDDLESRLYRRLYSQAAIAQAAGLSQPQGEQQQQQQQQQQLDGGKIRERLASSRRLAARRHFLEERLKRQARIKSKAYRRHARRARAKQEVAELTALKDSDPGAFAERLAALERARAEERISQRHGGGGRFAREQRLRARFDDSARQAVQEMLERGRELTEKADADADAAAAGGESGESGSDSDDDEAALGAQLPADLVDDWNVGGGDGDFAVEEDVPVPAALRPGKTGVPSPSAAAAAAAPIKEQRTLELDLTHLPALAAASEEVACDEDGDLVEQSATSASRRLARLRTDELLAADCGDAKAEFEQEKAAVAEQEQPKDVDLFLAGWNSWTGPGTRPVSAERRQQFVIKAPKRNRRDAAHGHVIIREKLESSQSRRRHLVKEVPFPYANAEQFEQAMRAPVCREFNSILAHKRLTAPRVSVRMGRAIGPVPKDAILRRRRRQRTSADIARGKN